MSEQSQRFFQESRGDTRGTTPESSPGDDVTALYDDGVSQRPPDPFEEKIITGRHNFDELRAELNATGHGGTPSSDSPGSSLRGETQSRIAELRRNLATGLGPVSDGEPETSSAQPPRFFGGGTDASAPSESTPPSPPRRPPAAGAEDRIAALRRDLASRRAALSDTDTQTRPETRPAPTPRPRPAAEPPAPRPPRPSTTEAPTEPVRRPAQRPPAQPRPAQARPATPAPPEVVVEPAVVAEPEVVAAPVDFLEPAVPVVPPVEEPAPAPVRGRAASKAAKAAAKTGAKTEAKPESEAEPEVVVEARPSFVTATRIETPQAVVATGVEKTYGSVTALRGVDLTITPDTFTAIMGPSAAGKSALMHCLAGLDTPTAGRIEVNGQLLTSMNASALAMFRRKIGYVFGELNLVDYLSVSDNICLPAVIAKVSVDRVWMDQVVTAFEVTDLLAMKPTKLTPDQQFRVAFARALILNPAIVFADEPTKKLETDQAKAAMGLVRSWVNQRRQTIVLATSSPGVALFADRVCVVKDGRIVEDIAKVEAGRLFEIQRKLVA